MKQNKSGCVRFSKCTHIEKKNLEVHVKTAATTKSVWCEKKLRINLSNNEQPKSPCE